MRRKNMLLLLAMMTSGSSTVLAQRSLEPVTIIKAGRVWDGEAGRMIPGQDIAVRGNRVTEVGSTLNVPAGATVIDARGCSALPGLIDVHTHILLEQRFAEPFSQTIDRQRSRGGEIGRTLAAVPRAHQYLDAGFGRLLHQANDAPYCQTPIMSRALRTQPIINCTPYQWPTLRY